jgi:hypothetical protein
MFTQVFVNVGVITTVIVLFFYALPQLSTKLHVLGIILDPDVLLHSHL